VERIPLLAEELSTIKDDSEIIVSETELIMSVKWKTTTAKD